MQKYRNKLGGNKYIVNNTFIISIELQPIPDLTVYDVIVIIHLIDYSVPQPTVSKIEDVLGAS